MIQRKQTIFLLLALAAMVVCLCLPIGSTASHGLAAHSEWYNLGVYAPNGLNAQPLLFIDLVVAGSLTLIDIFLYTRRRLQMKICVASIILCLVWYGYYVFRAVSDFAPQGSFYVGFAVCLPFVAIVFLILARRGIKADEDLIKSMDRIR